MPPYAIDRAVELLQNSLPTRRLLGASGAPGAS
eukprot:CAMPEP_0114168552 /NCGR_PEP_ID=MMETSP0043_2-20121206/33059_1 /TAXON_ID=464988 /ORGANISM="Hemiselmis andersenii, Strain CCMP644" /LENGTH=32 /DNA_ID= /DNA_START= /DNA_END= /DNA_ORIENTATION=